MSCVPWNSLSGLFVVPDQTPYFSSFSLSHTLLSFCDPHPSAAYPLMAVMAQAPTASSWAVFPDLSVLVPFDQSVLVFAGRQRASSTSTGTQLKNIWKELGEITSIKPIRDMGGKEKKILVIANVPSYQGSSGVTRRTFQSSYET
ncbi:hypothetical protein ATANTOWER_016392 [Ataeniobius toweri]|uniref:Uncharacterized protein n=1 Tax=Ataeniobius toweri TaxID=208326 RepID=A0ABU7BQ15_9TELE|nr:hypothetical protein [Ataeniobius toweri]